jgi:hypothetical protein
VRFAVPESPRRKRPNETEGEIVSTRAQEKGNTVGADLLGRKTLSRKMSGQGGTLYWLRGRVTPKEESAVHRKRGILFLFYEWTLFFCSSL